MRRAIAGVFVMSLMAAGASPALAGARPDKGMKPLFGHVSAGVLLPQGDFGDLVEDDLYFSGGATYWPEEWPVGLSFDLGYTETDIESSVIRRINDELPEEAGSVSRGDVRIWSLSTNLIWGPESSGAVGFYLTAGIGLDFLEAQLKDNGLVYYPPVCDPWFWWCTPGGVGPGTIVRLSEDSTEFAWNVGAGLTIETGSGSQVFIEARLKTAETDRVSTEYVPLVVGYRW